MKGQPAPYNTFNVVAVITYSTNIDTIEQTITQATIKKLDVGKV